MKPLTLTTTLPQLASWLDTNAEKLDTEQALAGEILPQLGRADLFRIGVTTQEGGVDGTLVDAIQAIASVANHSLTAALVFWGQRTFIEYLLQSSNEALRARWLPALLSGEFAGATGLSNAMKYLSNIEPLRISATPHTGPKASAGWKLDGRLPWITNLRRQGFLAAAAFDHSDGAPPSIFAIPHDAPGVVRSDDLDLIALRSSNTAALALESAWLDASWQISADAPMFLAQVRPAFLGLQCGLSIGLAHRALAAVQASNPAAHQSMKDDIARLTHELDILTKRLFDGIRQGTFFDTPAALFEVRIGLTAVVVQAVHLEAATAGGHGYLRNKSGTARRSREAAFVPIITPSVVQLKNQLAQYRRNKAA